MSSVWRSVYWRTVKARVDLLAFVFMRQAEKSDQYDQVKQLQKGLNGLSFGQPVSKKLNPSSRGVRYFYSLTMSSRFYRQDPICEIIVLYLARCMGAVGFMLFVEEGDL